MSTAKILNLIKKCDLLFSSFPLVCLLHVLVLFGFSMVYLKGKVGTAWK